jgi:hypothetical protein
MPANYALLNIAEERLAFWQGQLQAAFRNGNEKRAIECERMISEYAALTSEVMEHLRRSLAEEHD